MQPIQGLHTDFDPINQPPGTYRYALNAQATKNGFELASEYGFKYLAQIGFLPPTTQYFNVPIGTCPIDDNTIILFSIKNPFNPASSIGQDEIGLLTRNGSYTTLIRDNALNFSIDSPIQALFRKDYQNNPVVYWTDFRNPIRSLNINDIPFNLDPVSFNLLSDDDIVKLNLFDTTQPSLIDLIAVNDFGGSCLTGSLYFSIQYEDEVGNTTDFTSISNPISIVKDKKATISGNPPNNYSGDEAGLTTSKSVTIRINNVDTSYPYIRIAVIPKVNGNVTNDVRLLSKIPTSGSTTLSYTYTNLEPYEAIAIDDIIVNKARYSKAGTMTQVNDQLFIGNLETAADIGMQKYANLVTVDYVTSTMNINNVSNVSHYNEYYVYNNKGFMQDEVYSLYISYILNDGTESRAYHIPGRKPVAIDEAWNATNLLENNLLQTIINAGTPGAGLLTSMNENKRIDLANPADPLSTNVRYFHIYDTAANSNVTDLHGVAGLTSNMGYWENRNETYPDLVDWNSRSITGQVEDDLRGSKIRHHRIPSINKEFKDSTNEEFKVVGLKLKNVIIPSDLREQIKFIKVYYAKRDLGNSTILGYSLLTPQGTNATATAWYNSLGIYGGFVLDGALRGTPGSYPFTQDPSLKGYRLNNFELLFQKTDLNSATHLKNNYFLTTPMAVAGSLDYPATLISNALGVFIDYTKGASSYNDLTSADARFPYYSFRLNNTFYFNNNTPNVNAYQFNSGIYGTLKNIQNFWGEEYILGETITAFPSALPPGFGGLYPTFVDGSSANYEAQVVTKTAVNYLSSICAYKANVYTDFANYELVDTGFLYEIPSGSGTYTITDTTVAPLVGNGTIYGGDTFISGYGFRNTANCNLNLSVGGFIYPEFNISSLYWYPTPTTANINYRTKGDSPTSEAWYPDSGPSAIFIAMTFDKTNYIDYNIDYSAVNDLREIAVNPLNNTVNINTFSNRVARSEKQDKASLKDMYKIFKADDFRDLNRNRGKVESLETDGNRLIIHLTRALVRTTPNETLKTDSISAYLGQGDIFDIDPKEIVYTDTGYAGIQTKFAGVLSQYGYIFPDCQSGRVFKVSDSLEEISNYGMFNFFQDNLPFKLYSSLLASFENTIEWVSGNTYAANAFVKYNGKMYLALALTSANPEGSVDWEMILDYTSDFVNLDNTINPSTAGANAVWDNTLKRYILHKRDYEYNGDGVILPYSANYDQWQLGDYILRDGSIYKVSDYISPADKSTTDFDVYFNNGMYVQTHTAVLCNLANELTYFKDKSFTISYYPERKAWYSFHSYYPDIFFSTNTDVYSTSTSNSGNYFVYRHNELESILAFYTDNVTPIYDSFIVDLVYNENNQMSKIYDSVNFISSLRSTLTGVETVTATFNKAILYNSYQCTGELDLTNPSISRLIQGTWNINNFRDLIEDYSQPFFIDNELNISNIDYYKVYYERKRMVDNYLVSRYIFDNGTGNQKLTVQIYNTKIRPIIR